MAYSDYLQSFKSSMTTPSYSQMYGGTQPTIRALPKRYPPESPGVEQPPEQPRIPNAQPRTQDFMQQYGGGLAVGQPNAGPAQTFSPTPFMAQLYASTRNMSEEDQAGYLSAIRNKMGERLARFEYRMARGFPLTPQQNTQYKALLTRMQEINNMYENGGEMAKFFESPEGRGFGMRYGVRYE